MGSSNSYHKWNALVYLVIVHPFPNWVPDWNGLSIVYIYVYVIWFFFCTCIPFLISEKPIQKMCKCLILDQRHDCPSSVDSPGSFDAQLDKDVFILQNVLMTSAR